MRLAAMPLDGYWSRVVGGRLMRMGMLRCVSCLIILVFGLYSNDFVFSYHLGGSSIGHCSS